MTIEQIAAELQQTIREKARHQPFSHEDRALAQRERELEAQAHEQGYFFSKFDKIVTTHRYEA